MTREDWEKQALDYLRDNQGYCTIFWCMEHQPRACALGRLADRGVIRWDHKELGLGFPTCHAVIISDNDIAQSKVSV